MAHNGEPLIDETSDVKAPTRSRIGYFVCACLIGTLGLITGAGIGAYRSSRMAMDNAVTVRAGPIDFGFAQFMSMHHDQAVVMSQILLDDRLLTDHRPSRLRAFALSMSTAQLLEIGQMRGWLTLWGQPTYPATQNMGWMLLGSKVPDAQLSQYLLDCKQSLTGMPGMATDDQLDALRKMDRDQRDRHYLELMLAHHQGALQMARFAAANADVLVVRELALKMVRAQAIEVDGIRHALVKVQHLAGPY